MLFRFPVEDGKASRTPGAVEAAQERAAAANAVPVHAQQYRDVTWLGGFLSPPHNQSLHRAAVCPLPKRLAPVPQGARLWTRYHATRAPCRKVIGVPGQRSQAARYIDDLD